ncbi:DUF2309 domain-containing protein [Candidatus Magnetaquicoccus inordinatus]|uniref:DUF2309 domain-containing protein n=1 Tax=Candidatus Magnetaquicoccus inordinatus TaxID=2496818 RepID=UPI001D0DFDE4|nr:DUF2309 domain-containing protein [Candidatus Magnetaquicoccus inordinatus]
MNHEPDMRAADPCVQHLQEWLHHLEHHLPGQAPIRDFIHHNTLHGFQHLPFPEALRQAERITGIHGYWPLAQFRAAYRQGRINRADLHAELLAEQDLQAEQLITQAGFAPIQRLDLYREALLHDVQGLSASQLLWHREEQQALRRWQADLAEDVRRFWLSQGAEDVVVGQLWQACLQRLAIKESTAHPEEQLEDLLTFFASDSLSGEELDLRLFATLVREEAEALLDKLLLQLGTDLSISALLAHLSGEDPYEDLRPLLLRHVAAYLDQGLAGWSYPDRDKGFWSSWCRQARLDWSFLPEELAQWSTELDAMAEDATESVILLLTRMGLPEKRWTAYLQRLALRLPGWSGMMMWRHQHPGYEGISPQRVSMMDYLAVALFLEWLYSLRLCQKYWQIEPRIDTLRDYFRLHSAEFLVRWSLFHDPLPEYLAEQAGRMLAQSGADPLREEQWYALARMLRIGHQAPGRQGRKTAHADAWPLFLLAQHLGLTAQGLRSLSAEQWSMWQETLTRLTPDRCGYLWLQAYERHYRNQICNALIQNHGRGRWAVRQQAPAAQLIFCMDEREEGFRRHLEELAPQWETLGAAGFFGVPIYWQGLDEGRFTALCPVVVTPAHQICELPELGTDEEYTSYKQHRHWRLRLQEQLHQGSRLGVLRPLLATFLAAPGAIVLLLGKLLAPLATARIIQRWLRSLEPLVATRLHLNAAADAPAASPEQPRLGMTDQEQSDRVEGLLRTIGLTSQFAPLVVLVGHGSISQNNPHLGAYDCGACSGRHGGPNARVFATMANRPEVRALLRGRGITIPESCWFLGMEHNTASEELTWYDLSSLPAAQQSALQELQTAMEQARRASAHERSRRLASAPRQATLDQALAHVAGRSCDFSQARPELGHVTNAVAVIGRRSVSQGLFFDRRMFLISYDPTQDPSGKIVENILLAAGPVGAGISLEYYFSTVDNERFGCGSKITHNVTGLLGVMEGAASDLRTGLPKQMIEIHEAMRLLVIVEQQPEILTQIHGRQAAIRELVDNGWIVLAAKEPETPRIHLFRPGVGWQLWSESLQPLQRVSCSQEWYRGHETPLPPVWLGQAEEEKRYA